MAIHRFQPSHYFHTLGSHEPVLHVADGDTIITSSVDARGLGKDSEQATGRGNPMTGPFFVEGAEPGDTLVVQLDSVMPNRSFGWSDRILAANCVDPSDVPQLPWQTAGQETVAHWDVDIQQMTATLIEPQTALGAFKLPVVPMLGCFGVAPARGQAISTATSAEHGGNMDYRGFISGVTVYFPVFVPGALLHLGDGHAVQGDGEIAGTGIEISMDVQVTVHVQKGKTIRWPRGENAEYIFTVGNARPLDQCVQHATSEMLRWLTDEYGLDAMGASILLGQAVEYDLGNMFDPAYTMVCKVPKRVLAGVLPS
jgi:amidase